MSADLHSCTVVERVRYGANSTFAASCSCSWRGERRHGETDAEHDAYAHLAEQRRPPRTVGRPPIGPVVEVRLEVEVLEQLERTAAATGVKRAELIRSIVTTYVLERLK